MAQSCQKKQNILDSVKEEKIVYTTLLAINKSRLITNNFLKNEWVRSTMGELMAQNEDKSRSILDNSADSPIIIDENDTNDFINALKVLSAIKYTTTRQAEFIITMYETLSVTEYPLIFRSNNKRRIILKDKTSSYEMEYAQLIDDQIDETIELIKEIIVSIHQATCEEELMNYDKMESLISSQREEIHSLGEKYKLKLFVTCIAYVAKFYIDTCTWSTNFATVQSTSDKIKTIKRLLNIIRGISSKAINTKIVDDQQKQSLIDAIVSKSDRLRNYKLA